MKQKTVLFVLAACLVLALGSNLYAQALDYRIGPGDVLNISVWKNEDLTKQVIVLPDGRIHFPLVKELSVAGVSVSELEKMLREKLTPFVPEPDLSINVAQVNSMMIYVIGKVNSPGRFAMNTNIDVLQALAVAGGLNPFAKEKEIGVFRKIDGRTTIFNFNYKEVSEGINLEQNITLKRGDVIVVR
jgi:polysaccharide export outer membrane protein